MTAIVFQMLNIYCAQENYQLSKDPILLIGSEVAVRSKGFLIQDDDVYIDIWITKTFSNFSESNIFPFECEMEILVCEAQLHESNNKYIPNNEFHVIYVGNTKIDHCYTEIYTVKNVMSCFSNLHFFIKSSSGAKNSLVGYLQDTKNFVFKFRFNLHYLQSQNEIVTSKTYIYISEKNNLEEIFLVQNS
ncbi:hypothetical protein CDIK_1375 [Cucumispora dikerogammari]|nr:hypothetical protein CDIK_1375 [Cucumispora dikerogammari]